MEPVFLSLEEVEEIHAHQISRYGGSMGTRDVNLLASAVEMPRATFGGEFLHEGIFAMASAYLFHLVQNHPFVDGNKRVGLAATLAFLNFNGFRLVAEKDALVEMVLQVAQGRLGKPEIADYLRQNAKELRS